MKAVAPNAFHKIALGDRVVIRDLCVAAMKGRIKAGDLRDVRKEERMDRMGARLFGWCSGASGVYCSSRASTESSISTGR